MNVLSIIGDSIKLAKFIEQLLRQTPPSIGASYVIYDGNNLESHLRLVNIGLATIHGFRIWVTNETPPTGTSPNWHAIQRVFRIDEDINGKLVRYSIDIPKPGIYLRSNSPIFIPKTELPISINETSESLAKLQLRFEYVDPEGNTQEIFNNNVVVVRAALEDVSKN